MNAVAAPLAGAVVYNTTLNCLHQYTTTGWQSLCAAAHLKHSFKVTNAGSTRIYNNNSGGIVDFTTTAANLNNTGTLDSINDHFEITVPETYILNANVGMNNLLDSGSLTCIIIVDFNVLGSSMVTLPPLGGGTSQVAITVGTTAIAHLNAGDEVKVVMYAQKLSAPTFTLKTSLSNGSSPQGYLSGARISD